MPKKVLPEADGYVKISTLEEWGSVGMKDTKTEKALDNLE